MRGVEVAEVVLLAVGLLLVAAILLQFFRRPPTTSNKQPSSSSDSNLPVSVPTSTTPPTTTKRRRLILLLFMLCSGRRRHHSRVEPASAANSAETMEAAVEVDDVAPWRERWFGAVSRALYTIDEEEECSISMDEEERPSDPETPFYTPPASPHRLAAAA
ncbi:hypothetical protein PR202_gb03637 [Eleusine coracana subsp. coracana]|uniref:Uncharacterized protein n=1 Tax=Eleusine coracana subsp. coracana TaxID=191504 RepID=A0AAV5E2D4_ELECO|nr:hypothetical protein PR202_gb03637 [Eleusine coracana subsp. coracana]